MNAVANQCRCMKFREDFQKLLKEGSELKLTLAVRNAAGELEDAGELEFDCASCAGSGWVLTDECNRLITVLWRRNGKAKQ